MSSTSGRLRCRPAISYGYARISAFEVFRAAKRSPLGILDGATAEGELGLAFSTTNTVGLSPITTVFARSNFTSYLDIEDLIHVTSFSCKSRIRNVAVTEWISEEFYPA